ncbi:hypothetical protein FHR99_003157 [Litorivivens lipolytica]|uniref:RepA protein n=1 Tax=Litorivivens lipolytica TaxID=1524264 RepID=A0A7W4W8E9_9GAMM|nr:hypothetical protein [Litorivivens lipolytica]MBB3048883.1 hypothetical protein [Litorivivens lipolytica]
MAIQEEPAFLALLKSRNEVDDAKAEGMSAADVANVIARHGFEALPENIFRLMAPGQREKLGSLAFEIYDKVIAKNGNRSMELWFVPAPLIHSGIPAQNPGAATQYLTSSKVYETTISMPLAKNSRDQVKLPYGIPGRQVLSLLTTLALQSEEGEVINLPAIKTRFVEELFDIPAVGGKRGSVTRYVESLISWINATIHIVGRGTLEEEGRPSMPFTSVEPMGIVHRAVYWGHKDFIKSEGIQLTFSSYFSNLAKKHAVPIDREVQLKLAKMENPLAYDLVHWAAYRANSLRNDSQGVIRLSWKDFHDQFTPAFKSHYSTADAALMALEALKNEGISLPIIADKRGGLMLVGDSSTISGAVSPSQKPLF